MILILLHVRDPVCTGGRQSSALRRAGMTGLFSHARRAGLGCRRWRRARRGRGHGPGPSAQPAAPRSPRRPLNAASGCAFSRHRAPAARPGARWAPGVAPPWLPAGAGRSHAFISNRGAAQPAELPGAAGEAAPPCRGTGGRHRAGAADGGAGGGRVWAPPALPPRRPAPSAASARGSERSGDAAAPPRHSEVRGAAGRRGRGGDRAGAAACASVRCPSRLPRAAPRPALRCGRGRAAEGAAGGGRFGQAALPFAAPPSPAWRRGCGVRAERGRGVTWGEGLFLGTNAPPRAGRGCWRRWWRGGSGGAAPPCCWSCWAANPNPHPRWSLTALRAPWVCVCCSALGSLYGFLFWFLFFVSLMIFSSFSVGFSCRCCCRWGQREHCDCLGSWGISVFTFPLPLQRCCC